MPWNYFEIQLGDGFFIVADFTRVDGIVVSFVVRLMYMDEQFELVDIARYDGAHGVPHLDQMDHKGRLIQKQWIPGLDFDRAVEYALEDFKRNYEHYYRTWCKS
jgi:hypothetical protein